MKIAYDAEIVPRVFAKACGHRVSEAEFRIAGTPRDFCALFQRAGLNSLDAIDVLLGFSQLVDFGSDQEITLVPVYKLPKP